MTTLAPLTHGDPPNSPDKVREYREQGAITTWVQHSLRTVREGLLQVGLDGSQPLAARILGSSFLVAIPISMTETYRPYMSFEGEMWKPPTMDKMGRPLTSTQQKAAQLLVSMKRSQHEAVLKRQRLPAFWQLLGMAGICFGSAHISDPKQGSDPINGAGILTSWSAIYLIFFGRRVTKPATFALTSATAVLGLCTYGSYYYGTASWRDALPSLSWRIEGKPDPQQATGSIRLQ